MIKKEYYKNKTEICDEIWERIKMLIEKKNISQAELQRLCEAHGYKITQPEISKLVSGTQHLNLYQFIAFSEVLGISANHLINEKLSFQKVQVSGSSFALNPEEDEFTGYLGSYYTAFKSTSSFDDKILHGRITFLPVERAKLCGALLELDTGEIDAEGNHIFKFYQGELIVSKKMGVAYCILINEKIGEISMIEFRHRNFFVKQAECRLGLVLTVSAGEKKEPVTHRIFLSRTELDMQSLNYLIPYLKQEMDEILISKQKLAEIVEKLNKNADFSELLLKNKEEFFRIDEKDIRRINPHLSRGEVAKIMAFIKASSLGSFSCFLSEAQDGACFELIHHQ